MKILQVCSGTLVNGAIVHALMVTRELARRGHHVTLLCQADSWIGEQMATEPVRVVYSNMRRWPPHELGRVATLVRRRGIDVIQTHLSRAHFFGVLLRWMTGVPCVATAQSRHFQLHWMFNDCVVAASEATRTFHCRQNLVRPSRAVTIHNFADVRRLHHPAADARQRVRREFDVPDDALLIGSVGDLVPRKGQLSVVEALPRVLAAAPNARLVLVGPAKDPDYTALVRQRAEQLGVAAAVVFAGRRDDMPDVYAALDIKILASLEDSLPLAILEAMAAGLPVVATTTGGIPECVHDGKTGLLVPPGDSDALATALVRLLGDPALRRACGQAGQQLAAQSFSPESHARALEGVFARLIRHRAAA